MLSIGKIGLARSQQLYYEHKVAKGVDDYYAGRGEAPGRWTGAGAKLLGLTGELDAEQLTALMDGKDPRSGNQLCSRTGKSSIAAFDLTFSAPKSVSVLFAVGNERLSRALVEAHEEAVDAAVSYLGREACRVRRGHNGTKEERAAGDPRGWERARVERGGGLLAAAYRHRMSRAQDPQLHTHVVCANMACGQDGRWTALDGRAIYDHAKAGGYVYEAHLRKAVRERVPWAEWGPVREGIAELVVVPAAVREEFSQRRRRILERERELESAGVIVGFQGRERIAYDTREAKRQVAEEDWRAEVRARAAEHGLGQTEIERLGHLPPARPRPPASESNLAARLFAPTGLTAARNTFHRRDVVIAVAGEQPDGASAETVVLLAERMLAQPESVPVSVGFDSRYTTRELLAKEELIVDHAERGTGQCVAVLEERHLSTTTHCLGLSEEQRRVVHAITRSGNRIDTIEALAGTGKTTAAGALRRVYEEAGYRVLGAAPTARGVRELKERAGIRESRTLDGWAVKLAAEPDTLACAEWTEGGVRPQPTVMLIDEAGMAHTRVSAAVVDRAVSANVKVVAIGDSGQLSSVQAGGWLGALSRRLGSHELREVMRQRDPVERRALAKVHRGEPDPYLKIKRDRAELRVVCGREPGRDAEGLLIEAWAAACEANQYDEAVMICRDNVRRERLNELARTHLRLVGVLGESVEIGGRQWAVGDRVIARRNDRGRDLDNGTRGTVTAVEAHRGLMVQVDGGDTRDIDRAYVERHLDHAYALTGHGMQGGTVHWAGVIGQPRDFSRNWSYTALSRARDPVAIFVVDEPTRIEQERELIAPPEEQPSEDPLERMARRMRERDDEDLALEQLEHAREAADAALDQEIDPGAAASPRASQDHPLDGLNQRVSPFRAMVYELDDQLGTIRQQLRSEPVKDAKAIDGLRQTIAAIEEEHARDPKPRAWRDRAAHELRKREREHHLAELRDQEARLLKRTPDPDRVLREAGELREQQRMLGAEYRAVRKRAIDDELAQRPPWVESTIGPEQLDIHLEERRQWAARELAGYRIDHRIADPDTAFAGRSPEASIQRTVAECREHLGLQPADRVLALDLDR
jgi:conjugative relaxase-like TrwC/TraI family protein